MAELPILDLRNVGKVYELNDQRIEALRDQLITGDSVALTRFMAQFPHADSQHIRQLIRNAQFEKTKNKPPHAYRELFRVLREVHKDPPAD